MIDLEHLAELLKSHKLSSGGQVSHNNKLSSDFIRENYDSSLSISDNAEKLGMKESTLRSRLCVLEVERLGKYRKPRRGVSQKAFVRVILASSMRKSPRKRPATKEELEEVIEYLGNKPPICEITGLPLEVPISNGHRLSTLSVDRIDNSLPYQVGNVRLVHKHINIMKNNIPDDIFYMLSQAVVERKEYNDSILRSRDENLP